MLGDGTTTPRPTPVAVSGLSGVGAIAADAGHSLAMAREASHGDFKGDGHPDLLWENRTTGDVTVSYLNRATVLTGESIAHGVNTQWRIVGPK